MRISDWSSDVCSSDLAFSIQAWDPSGPPSPFGGGLGVFVFDDGVEVGSGFFTPAWGEIGRAHVLTPVTNAHIVCRLLLEKKNIHSKLKREKHMHTNKNTSIPQISHRTK